MRKLVILGLVLVAGLAIVPSTTAGPGRNALLAAMDGAQERPVAGDPDGFGAAAVEIRGRRICFRVIVGNIEPSTAAHIHRGRTGEPGPIVVPLFTGQVPARTRCVRARRSLARRILRRPRNYYVNVHNAAFPAGAIRGQLAR